MDNTTVGNSNFSLMIDLEQLNRDEAIRRLPVVLFIFVLMSIGIFGNIHVLYIYYKKFGHSTYRVFVLSLATVDMVSCCISMPFEIADELNPFDFSSEIPCKIFRYINTCLAMMTSVMLVVIASERHRRICKPYGNQMTEQQSKKALLAVVGFASFAALPAIYVYGNKTIEINQNGQTVIGMECTWADYVNATVGYAYYAWGLLIILVCMVLLVALYILVGLHLRTHTIKIQSTIKLRRRKSRRRRSLFGRNSLAKKGNNADGSKDRLKYRHSSPNIFQCKKVNRNENEKTEVRKSRRKAVSEQISCDSKQQTPNRSHASLISVKSLETGILLTKEPKHVGCGSKVTIDTSLDCNMIPKVMPDNECASTKIYLETENRDAEKDAPACITSDVLIDVNEPISADVTESSEVIVITSQDTPTHVQTTRRGGTIMKKNKTFISEREQRITKVLFTITLLYIVSFLPYVIILIVYAVDDTYEKRIEATAAYPIYLMALRLYLVNNVANSILYMLIDFKFRKSLLGIYKRKMK